ncbi:MAG: mitochondrial 37S ribosomal protein nam9 [Alectoria sarmentosa]|nr:MAG: mitochondrial 37S ribosomal protein nam9 [Alectoria sarmentosa]CAD6592846.1 MAG: mitochondrial 37S ribosomal protein nam9 [Alectoria sarmentosa]
MRKRFHGLKRIKLRQSWNKYNLFNFSRVEPPKNTERTFFQQKWTAKALTRAYHGETVREKQWIRTFRRTIRSVVPMDYKMLAEKDGSEQAEGRGSGLESPPDQKTKPFPRTPYLNMTYAPMERRLDTAIFRALFASSTRQARQFVVHGYVRVNGQKMIYPGYQLNPGDMFQVEPDRVLYATGAPKDKFERRAGRKIRAKYSKKASTSEAPDEAEPRTPKSDPSPEPISADKTPKGALQFLLGQAKELLATPSTSLTAKRKQDLRAFQRTVKRTLGRPKSMTATSLDSQLAEIVARMNAAPQTRPASPSSSTTEVPELSTPELQAEAATLDSTQLRTLRDALKDARENPVDPSKPYATPWRPREWMSAFAFVPRYLEVHSRVCAAVYLRHPVARPGLAEVPTPYGTETNSLAHNWYLRRR